MSNILAFLRDGFGLSLVALGFILGMVVDAMRRIWTSSVPDFEQQQHQQQPREKADERFNATAEKDLRVCTWLTLALAICAGALLLAFSGPASADEWHGKDKQQHVIAGAVVAGSVQQLTGSPWRGFLAGAAVGIGKELIDMRTPGSTPSHRDAIVTLAGAALATTVPGLSIGPGWVAWRVEF